MGAPLGSAFTDRSCAATRAVDDGAAASLAGQALAGSAALMTTTGAIQVTAPHHDRVLNVDVTRFSDGGVGAPSAVIP